MWGGHDIIFWVPQILTQSKWKRSICVGHDLFWNIEFSHCSSWFHKSTCLNPKYATNTIIWEHIYKHWERIVYPNSSIPDLKPRIRNSNFPYPSHTRKTQIEVTRIPEPHTNFWPLSLSLHAIFCLFGVYVPSMDSPFSGFGSGLNPDFGYWVIWNSIEPNSGIPFRVGTWNVASIKFHIHMWDICKTSFKTHEVILRVYIATCRSRSWTNFQ